MDALYITPWQPYLQTNIYDALVNGNWVPERYGSDGQNSSIQNSGNINFTALGGGGGKHRFSSGGGSASGAYQSILYDWPLTNMFHTEPPLTLSNYALGYHSTDDYFIISDGSAHYNDDPANYSNVMVYGNKGGAGGHGGGGTDFANGGGGGAGGMGGTSSGNNNATDRRGGDGGPGIENTFVDGTSQYYGGGGGAGTFGTYLSSGGIGGGGNAKQSGEDGRGGGGGSHSYNGWSEGPGGDGGSGLVVIRFPSSITIVLEPDYAGIQDISGEATPSK